MTESMGGAVPPEPGAQEVGSQEAVAERYPVLTLADGRDDVGAGTATAGHGVVVVDYWKPWLPHRTRTRWSRHRTRYEPGSVQVDDQQVLSGLGRVAVVVPAGRRRLTGLPPAEPRIPWIPWAPTSSQRPIAHATVDVAAGDTVYVDLVAPFSSSHRRADEFAPPGAMPGGRADAVVVMYAAGCPTFVLMLFLLLPLGADGLAVVVAALAAVGVTVLPLRRPRHPLRRYRTRQIRERARHTTILLDVQPPDD